MRIQKEKTILAIETSCDETAIAIVKCSHAAHTISVRVLSSLVASQAKLHAKFGGVVPNLARREHQKNLIPLLRQALNAAGVKKSKTKNQNAKSKLKIQKLNEILARETNLLEKFKRYIVPLEIPPIDALAVTSGPGLSPALWVGVNFSRALSSLWDVPLIPVNHMEGHLFSALLQIPIQRSKSATSISAQISNSEFKIQNIKTPALALLVSGGHTELVLMEKFGKYKIIGETLDDAAGEAFDKVARILGLGYPGGPAIAKEAQSVKRRAQNNNAKLKIKLPRPMINSGDYNFSFSGLKTATLYLVRDLENAGHSIEKLRPVIAREFQDAAIEILVKKTVRAMKEYKAKTLLLGGGVAANTRLRKKMQEAVRENLSHVLCLISHVALAGDNALMVALAACLTGKAKPWQKVAADPNARLSD